MRIKLTIVLIILNLVAFYWIYELEKGADPRDSYSQETVNVLPNAASVDEIRIQVNTAQKQDERVLKRNRNYWEITSPFVWAANENAVQRILTQLQFLEKETSIPLADIEKSSQSLADFGLENPTIILSYHAGEKTTVLKIGSPTEMGNRIYLLPEGSDEVYVVSNELLRAITISLAELRSDQVFNIPLFEVRSLSIEQGNQRYRFEETDDTWWLVTPIRARADSARMDAALGELVSLRSLNNVRDLPSGGEAAIFAQPMMRITLSGNNRRRTLVVGAPVENLPEGEKPMRYARLEDDPASATIFTVDASRLESLQDPAERLRERKFLRFNPASVNAVEISQDSQSLTLQKLEKRQSEEPDTWQIFRRDSSGSILTEPADANLVALLLLELRKLEAREFVSDAPSDDDLKEWGLATPHTRLTLKDGTDQTLLLGIDAGSGKLYAKLESEPFVYEIGSLILRHISSDPLLYRSRVLNQSLVGARVVSLELTDLEENRVILSEKIDQSKDTWSTYLQSRPEKEAASLIALIDQLEDFHVSEYLYTKFEPLPGKPWRYKLVVEYFLPGTTDSSTTRREYDFSVRTEATRQVGGSPADKLTFMLVQPMIDALFPLTFVPEAPELPDTPEGVESATPPSLPTTEAPAAEPKTGTPESGESQTAP